MKTKLGFILRFILAFSLVFSSNLSSAKDNSVADAAMPELKGIAADPSDPYSVELAPDAQQLIDKKVRDFQQAPARIKFLQKLKLGSYFTRLRGTQRPTEQEVEVAAKDAKELLDYYQQDDRAQTHAEVTEKQIKPFLRSLTLGKLMAPVRNGRISEPIAKWTMESFVVRMLLKEVGKRPDRIKQILSLISGSHLKGSTRLASALVMGAAVYYMMHDYGGAWLSREVIATIVVAFRAGPMGTVMNALTAWFINPTVEFIKVRTNRYTAPLETKINSFYDKFTPKPQEDSSEDAKLNTTPKISDFSEDGMSFGGMSVEDERSNWTKVIGMFVALCKHYYKLLRDTQHAGRGLIINSWNDEMSGAMFIENMDSKLAILSVEEMQLLNPYQSAFLMRDEAAKKERLDLAFDEFRELCSRTWSEEHSDEELKQLGAQILISRENLRSIGLPEYIIEKLWDIQKRRAHTVESLTTGLALYHFKLFVNAESNRNLEESARATHRALHRGFSLERFLATYGTKIAKHHRAMGFRNSGERIGPACQTLLESAVQ